MTQALVERIKAQIENLDGGKLSEAVHAFGPTASLTEAYVIQTLDDSSPFLKEIERIRAIRYAGVVGEALTRSEYMHKYGALRELVKLVHESREILREPDPDR